MSSSIFDQDSSMDEYESDVVIVNTGSEDETDDSETGSDRSTPARYSDDPSPVALATGEEIFSTEDASTLAQPELGIIDDVAAIVEVVSDGHGHPIQRTEQAAAATSANSSMSDFRPAKRAKLSNDASEDSDEEAEVCC